MNRAWWYLLKNIIGKEDIAAGMVANIVLMIMRPCPSPGVPSSCDKKKYMATKKIKLTAKKTRPVAKKRSSVEVARTAKEKLKALKPSGQKDDSFFELVHEVARQIPRGRITSYGAIAACLGTRLSARMVGWAMNVSGSATKSVPAHRVVNRNGLLSGKHHFNPPSMMETLLKKEGIKVVNDKIVDFDKLFWDPAREL
jgi:methylated-DNA-protein-cysteine methyltransferase related protein